MQYFFSTMATAGQPHVWWPPLQANPTCDDRHCRPTPRVMTPTAGHHHVWWPPLQANPTCDDRHCRKQQDSYKVTKAPSSRSHFLSLSLFLFVSISSLFLSLPLPSWPKVCKGMYMTKYSCNWRCCVLNIWLSQATWQKLHGKCHHMMCCFCKIESPSWQGKNLSFWAVNPLFLGRHWK